MHAQTPAARTALTVTPTRPLTPPNPPSISTYSTLTATPTLPCFTFLKTKGSNACPNPCRPDRYQSPLTPPSLPYPPPPLLLRYPFTIPAPEPSIMTAAWHIEENDATRFRRDVTVPARAEYAGEKAALPHVAATSSAAVENGLG